MRTVIILLAWLSACSSTGTSRPYNGEANSDATVIVGAVRFTVLTDRLIRVERKEEQAKFEDCPTMSFLNRKLDVPPFTVTNRTDGSISIQTNSLVLEYRPTAQATRFAPNTLQVTGIRANFNFTYRYGDVDPHNLLGTIRTLDLLNVVSLNCSHHPPAAHCEYGLVSRSGYSIVNDTGNWCLTNDQNGWDHSNGNLEDFYVFGHGHDYKAALYEYTLVGGSIPLLPPFVFGVWYSRWYDYTPQDVKDIVTLYEQYSLPLDVFVLDMNWHTKNHWTGYSWDSNLYVASDALTYLKGRGLAVTLNLHDANGVQYYESQYNALCNYLGIDPSSKIPVNFTIVNQTVSEAIDDIVLHPLQDQGVDFWWIDWQQGEMGPGGSRGGKHNPTIWTAHTRTRQPTRLLEDRRTLVLARWGGLGAHRYPVHFSGDVETMSWETLAFQMYFSMTGVNVGAIWSHDIHAPSDNPELYVRFVQWSVFSGVSRAHERGYSAGDCVRANADRVCAVVEPWNVPWKFAEANFEALRLRGELLPYLYTASYHAHLTGLWFTTPMYYEWPELEGAYETAAPQPNDATKVGPQFMFGEDMWVAPITKPANKKDGLLRTRLWIPPGKWVAYAGGKVEHGSFDGFTYVDVACDLRDVPLYARAGAVIPTRPIRTGATIGLAGKSYSELLWTIYLTIDAPRSGSGTVYEDDGKTLAYARGSYSVTSMDYNILEQTDSERITIPVSIRSSAQSNVFPPRRYNTIRLVNTLPPHKVTYRAKDIPWSRFGGRGTWSYDSTDMAVVVEIPLSTTTEDIEIVVETCSSRAVDGVGFKIARARAAKAVLDEARIAPGSQTGDKESSGALLLAASMGTRLDYFAGYSQPQFKHELDTLASLLSIARREVAGLMSPVAANRGLGDNDGNDPEILRRVSKALSLLDAAIQ